MDDLIKRAEAAVYLIRKHGLWYRPNECGYTGSAIQAGRYTKEDAENITHPNGKDGPRDGMSYVHEDAVIDGDWIAHRDLIAALRRVTAERDAYKDAHEKEQVVVAQCANGWKSDLEASRAALNGGKTDD